MVIGVISSLKWHIRWYLFNYLVSLAKPFVQRSLFHAQSHLSWNLHSLDYIHNLVSGSTLFTCAPLGHNSNVEVRFYARCTVRTANDILIIVRTPQWTRFICSFHPLLVRTWGSIVSIEHAWMHTFLRFVYFYFVIEVYHFKTKDENSDLSKSIRKYQRTPAIK